MSFDIVGLGTVVVDHQIVLEHYPEEDSKTPILADRLQVGGPVPTALVLLGRWGRRCSFIGSWGDDHLGQTIEADLCQESMDIRYAVRRIGKKSGFAHVWIDQSTGTRTIAHRRGECAVVPEEVNEEAFASAKGLHLDGTSCDAAIKAAHAIREHGGRVFLDAGLPKPNIERLLPYVDIMSCPIRFVHAFFPEKSIEDASHRLLAFGIQAVVVTRGNEGAVLYYQDKVYSQAAFPVKVQDSTGAGDVFSAGLIHGVLHDWAWDRILPFASAAAALKIAKLGNREALPTEQEVVDYLASVTTKLNSIYTV